MLSLEYKTLKKQLKHWLMPLMLLMIS